DGLMKSSDGALLSNREIMQKAIGDTIKILKEKTGREFKPTFIREAIACYKRLTPEFIQIAIAYNFSMSFIKKASMMSPTAQNEMAQAIINSRDDERNVEKQNRRYGSGNRSLVERMKKIKLQIGLLADNILNSKNKIFAANPENKEEIVQSIKSSIIQLKHILDYIEGVSRKG
ncbi:MAG: hypothetical protein NZM04_01045, partial [Methylacidiphilales bacterium]|nr:hypothetical protein [Candidatus Methylacidiphilales bacterium]